MASKNDCNICEKAFGRKDNLKRHVQNVHKRNHLLFPTTNMTKSVTKILTNEQNMSSVNQFEGFDKRLQLPHNFIYAGASQSGKTSLLIKTLENASTIYNPIPTRIFFLYSCFQTDYEKLQGKLALQGIRCDFIKQSVVTEADLDNMADPHGGQTLIILDDNSISAASSTEMAHVFTIARHKNCSIVLLLHFIFGPWASGRIISANTSYFFLLKSPRMVQQISTLGSQLGKQKALRAIYEQESKKRYGYVLVDLCTATPDYLRLRTDIFNDMQLNTVKPEVQQGSKPEPVAIKQKVKNKFDSKKDVILKRNQIFNKRDGVTQSDDDSDSDNKSEINDDDNSENESEMSISDSGIKSENNDDDDDDDDDSSDNKSDGYDHVESESDAGSNMSQEDNNDEEEVESEDSDDSYNQELYRKLIDRRNNTKSRWYTW